MSFLDYVNRFNTNMHLYHLGGQDFNDTSKVSILLDKIRVAEGNPISATVRNIKCDVKYKGDFNAVVKRIQQDLIGGKTNHSYKKPRIGAVVQDKNIVQRPSGKLPKGLDQNDLTKYVESFHSLPQEWKHYLVYLRKAKNNLKQKKDGDAKKSGTDYITSKAFNTKINEINAALTASQIESETALTAAFAEQMVRIESLTSKFPTTGNRNRIGRISSSDRSVVVNSLITED